MSSRFDKILAKAHQFYAVREALDRAVKTHTGRGQVGVVWHTQGSGKSYSMLFFARAAMREKALHNPTIVVVTDRTDLDSQGYTNVGVSFSFEIKANLTGTGAAQTANPTYAQLAGESAKEENV